MKLIFPVLITVIIIFLTSCAIQVAPGGGEKDVKPPELISSQPENFSTNFSGHDIVLNFDEYIALNDIGSQLIISPLLNNTPQIKIRKKSLLIHFNDTLLANTTYTLNFGLGIMDNNEGNKLQNFHYVFSTGSIIDSNFISGKIINAFDRKIGKGNLALLYKTNNDSLPYLERPVYFARTNDSGDYRIVNISPGSYKLVGLKDNDGNYLYTPAEELIAFSDSLIPSNTEKIDLNLFREVSGFRFLRAYSEFPGKAFLVFNGPVDSINIKYLTDTNSIKLYAVSFSEKRDTINFWYKNTLSDSLSLSLDTAITRDTISIRLFKKQVEKIGKRQVAFTIGAGSTQGSIQHLYLPYYMQSNHPIAEYDFEKIVITEDSIIIKPKISFLDSLHLKLKVDHVWKGKGNYNLFIPPATFTDIYDLKNDSVQLSFTVKSETDYGSLRIKFQNNSGEMCVIQLVDDAGFVYRELSAKNDTSALLSNLDPKIYKIKLVYDSNGNGKWDTGNYLKKIQPEMIEFYPDAITVRANWDVDVTVKSTGGK